jgi:hypothetical protein
VKEFGAKGDGVTDDTAAIEAAISAARRGGVTELVFENGVFLVSKALVIDFPVLTLRGTGAYIDGTPGACIKQATANEDVLRISASNGIDVKDVHVRDISVQGNLHGTTGSGIVVSAKSPHVVFQCSLERVVTFDCAEHGIKLSGVSGAVFACSMDQIETLFNRGNGIRLESVGQIDVGRVYAESNLGDQIHIVGTKTMPCVNIVLRNPSLNAAPANKYCLRATLTCDLTVIGMYSESAVGGLILLESVRGFLALGGSIAQGVGCRGLVVRSGDASIQNDGVHLDIPRWINAGPNPRLDVSAPGTALDFHLGSHADGPFTPSDVKGYSTAVSAKEFVFAYPATARMLLDDWYYDRVPRNAAATLMVRNAALADGARWYAPKAGWLRAVSVWLNPDSPCTAGALTLTVYKNGSIASSELMIDPKNQRARHEFGKSEGSGTYFAAGDYFVMSFKTSSTWSASPAADAACLRASMEVEF